MTTTSGVQYSGIWTLQQAHDAVAAGTWPAAYNNYSLYSWGWNANGQLGLGDTTGRSSPVQVGSLTDWVAIAGGNRFTIATKGNGTLWSWGKNDYGQLGLGNIT